MRNLNKVFNKQQCRTSYRNHRQIRKKIVFVILMYTVILTLFYTQNIEKVLHSRVLRAEEFQFLFPNDSKYIVNSPKCKILNLDPFDPQAKAYHELKKYYSCTQLDLLTYITKNGSVARLQINKTVLPFYSKNKVVCSYANITREDEGTYADTPVGIYISDYYPFNDSIILNENPVMVKCEDIKENRNVYENVHEAVVVKKDVLKKQQNFNKKNESFSVLLLGIDSVSRLNFIRNLPNSYKYLMDQDWISLNGYNKIDDNTFPNVMAFLTGYKLKKALKVCQPNVVGMLNRCPLLWYDYRRLGYVTAYAEDDSELGTFNLKKEGFSKRPTDYYFRPYVLASERLKITTVDEMKYCTGPESSGERILNLAKDFAITFKDTPNFGLFWMNTFSHNGLNVVSKMDYKIKQFLEEITESGALSNSVVIFLSDHGIRCGKFRETAMGWFEERLPFIYIWIPETFKEKFPTEYTNLKKNINKLTSPFDLFMTLQHLLILSGMEYKIKPSHGCPKCQSLFSEIESERSCEDAGIVQHWCTCADFGPLGHEEGKIVHQASEYLLKELHNVINNSGESDKCAQYSIAEVTKAGVSRSYDTDKYLFLLTVKTKPKAVFEATLVYNKFQQFQLSGEISRIDWYEPHSKCTHNAHLKKYCYCLSSITTNS